MSMRKVPTRSAPAIRVQKEMNGLAKSFRYAIQGFRFAIDNERNMRIHLMVAIAVLEFAWIYGLDRMYYAILFMMFGLVLTAEMMNTAIEALVNLKTQSFTPLARVAKDVAAGAVMVLAIAAVFVACILFGDFTKLEKAFTVILDTPLLVLGFLIEFILAYLFIFRWEKRRMLMRNNRRS